MGDRKTAAQRLEDRFNLFLVNEWPHLRERVAAMEVLQKVVLAVTGTILAGVIAAIILTVVD